MRKNYRIKHKALPEDCKTFLDVIDVMQTSKENTLDGLLNNVSKEKQQLEKVINREVETTFDEETTSALLDNYSRLIKVEDFFKKYFENV